MTPSRDTGWTSRRCGERHRPGGGDEDARSAAAGCGSSSGTAKRAARRAAAGPWRLVDPLAPMIGCFGVAPPPDKRSPPDQRPYGGNMDYRRFAPGTAAHFPVAVPGALFYLGDGHACQGDGEIVATGIETSFEIEFTVRLAKGKTIGWPRGETADDIFTVGNARPLDQALQHATTEMLAWLGSDYGLDPLAASHVLGSGGAL